MGAYYIMGAQDIGHVKLSIKKFTAAVAPATATSCAVPPYRAVPQQQ